MRPNVRAYFLLGTSFLVGGVSGFFIAKKLLQEHYEELALEEINEVRAYYFDKYESKERHAKLAEQYNKPDNPRDLINDDDDVVIFEELQEDEDDEENLELLEEVVKTDPVPEKHLIDYNIYSKGADVFDSVDLYYYRLDGIMCDKNDVVNLYPQDVLGYEGWEEALKKNNTIFVRDEVAKIDYAVHAISQSFNDAISTRLETDREKQIRRLAREKDVLDDFQMENLDLDDKINTYEEVIPRKPKNEPYERPQNPRYDTIFKVNDEE